MGTYIPLNGRSDWSGVWKGCVSVEMNRASAGQDEAAAAVAGGRAEELRPGGTVFHSLLICYIFILSRLQL